MEKSTANVSADSVIAAAEAWLARRTARVAKEREVMIEEKMTTPRRTGLFGSKTKFMTRDEAIAALKNESDGLFSVRWYSPERGGLFWVSVVEQLIILAKTSKENGSGFVSLTATDANLLF